MSTLWNDDKLDSAVWHDKLDDKLVNVFSEDTLRSSFEVGLLDLVSSPWPPIKIFISLIPPT